VKERGAEEFLRAVPAAQTKLLAAVLAAADARGFAVYAVGGPVRDWLLGRGIADVDLIVEPRDGEGAQALGRAVKLPDLRRRSHDRFGTLRLSGAGGEIDLATVRRETYAHPGALPTTEPGSLEEDLLRRDFSVNALALALSRAARARHRGVVDVAEGLADLAERRLRVLHPASFQDDPTRVLRAARLAPRLGFALARDSRSALRDALRLGTFGRVSGDRLRREIEKLFADAALGLDPTRALRLLESWHVLGALEPGLGLPRDAHGPLRRLGRAVREPPWSADRWRIWVSGLALWLAPLAPALRRRSLARFAVRGAWGERIAGFSALREAKLEALLRARGRGAVDAALAGLAEEELHALWAVAPPAARRRVARFASQDRTRRAPVSGADLLALGLRGPEVGRALGRIRAAFLDGVLRTREEAMALARELSVRRRASPARGRGGGR
jgi:tRNA nucleotidyltransferase (CCA-adding enzyme)